MLLGDERRFLGDDPLTREPETQDASGAQEWTIDLFIDLATNLFSRPGDPTPDVRARNVNTIDEVPDSNWFTNRILARALTPDDVARGPLTGSGPAPGTWSVVSRKLAGVAPGFTMRDAGGEIWFVSFDAAGHPEAATGAIMAANKLFWALGYWQVENYLIAVRPDQIAIAETATFTPPSGRERRMRARDLDDVFARSHQSTDGTYRAVAARAVPGRPIGGFRYYGTRPDDPNDLVRHEHRRELRGARVFGAWLNHDDSRSVNSLDMLMPTLRGSYVKHYMFDFGSILGSGTVYQQRHRAGNEYLLEWKPGWLSLATLGLYTRPWMHIDYPEAPLAVGRLEAEAFDPAKWRPEYPNPAFRNMRADDAFWAARLVSRFTDGAIRAVVEKARFTDPRATDDLTAKIIKRRDKVVALWLTQVNPLIDFALSDGGELTFANAAQRAGVATPAKAYRVQWARFDNATGTAEDLSEPVVLNDQRAQAPAALISREPAPEFIEVRVVAVHPAFPAWGAPVTAHFRRAGPTWKLVGLARMPD